MAEATNELFDTGITEHLQDLVLQSSDVEHFLHELAAFTAARLGEPGQKIYCGITLVRRKKSVTIASSDENARVLDDLQNTFGDGPCLTAIRESESVLVPDVHTEHRWPEYMEALKDHGVRSILGVPLGLDGEAGAGLNLYAGWANGFSGEAIKRAENYALRASKALNLAVRMAHLIDARDNLKAAMESRTTIDLAVGIVMGQNRCSQEAAFKILKNASSTRNIKLREVAATIVASVTATVR
ncbi:GAF and ANTAR domain-containing protein [Arthrobacter crystallopoietes]|uniref:GAF domain-containing protein n=1 Tax=Crystallibacter crystallopoietes TaxID=37928 RepID=A0A1H0ZTW8_9MICC|nr:GAF and ANTAR domain-containing protein [Arthrobacter crystallopoietes]AUI51817.1 response regulator receiver protein [Arthrobacter crystallopoietes]SDQ30867.1 GAF domain-containing protein [Arthrobacter crystallopoietes]